MGDEPLLRLMAPEIAKDVRELRPLPLTRCAWAYNMLAVHTPELVAAISGHALRELAEFPPKALVKLMDSTYVSWRNVELDNAMALTIGDVATNLQTTWATP